MTEYEKMIGRALARQDSWPTLFTEQDLQTIRAIYAPQEAYESENKRRTGAVGRSGVRDHRKDTEGRSDAQKI
jgi:hypothetical protein